MFRQLLRQKRPIEWIVRCLVDMHTHTDASIYLVMANTCLLTPNNLLRGISCEPIENDVVFYKPYEGLIHVKGYSYIK